jgi:arylsulfatase A-like enzyme
MSHTRRDFLQATGMAALAYALGGCGGPSGSPSQPRPNVLFISLDDLNDWIEPLGGHPQARTPNLNRFAEEGINFTRSYCASPSCLPSRTALLTGVPPYRSGVYSNYQYWREVMPNAVTLPKYFTENGYFAAGAGKIFHNDQPDPESWEEYFPSMEQHMPRYHYPSRGQTVSMPAFEDMYGDFDWSPIPLSDEETGDFSSVAWVMEQLGREHDEPFFLGCGIYRPHLPWYVPQEYYDLFPLDEVQLPRVLADDLSDLGERAVDIAYRSGNYHRHVVEAGEWRRAVQGYLASIAFCDGMVGRLLDALEASPHADNTIVVLWSDHGWQLGEKEHWRKFALWDNVIRTVLMVRVPEGVPGLPEGTRAGERCDRIVSLLDLFPTLLDLCGLPEKAGLGGRSLAPLLEDPRRQWEYPAITTYDFNEFSIRTEGWHYIHYIDDSEELYDLQADPEEWRNLAGDPAYRGVRNRLAGYMPSDPAPVAETSYRLAPHHIPPLRSKDEYLALKRGQAQEGR